MRSGNLLTAKERAVLDFERNWKPSAATKDDDIRQTFGFSPTRYYQLLNRLLLSSEALAYDPQLVSRLTRLREKRLSDRAHRVSPNTHRDLRD
jgi:hypothetical protein